MALLFALAGAGCAVASVAGKGHVYSLGAVVFGVVAVLIARRKTEESN